MQMTRDGLESNLRSPVLLNIYTTTIPTLFPHNTSIQNYPLQHTTTHPLRRVLVRLLTSLALTSKCVPLLLLSTVTGLVPARR
jgi:hypothetical protein